MPFVSLGELYSRAFPSHLLDTEINVFPGDEVLFFIV